MERTEGKTVKQVLENLGTDMEGLAPEQVKKNRELYGWNKLKEEKQIPAILIFFSQFKDFLVLILIIAAAVSAMMGKIESTLVIVAVLILNATLGTVQHIKAEQSLKSLKALSTPSAKVLRNGLKQEIPSEEVVVGDILILEAGDYVSGDGRVIESNSLQTNESALTGESLSVEKITGVIEGEGVALGDQINRVFSSSYVTYGRGLAVVTAVGEKTEIGKIAELISNAKEKATPLQQNLDAFGKKLSMGILIICALVFGLSLYRNSPIMDALMFAISLAVAAIPEALSSIVTIVLALGTRKLAAENAIIRKLHSVESLGSISVICSDKTGTLTQNKMTVQSIYVDNQVVEVKDIDKEDELTNKLVLAGLLCSDAVTTNEKSIGDPTEVALVDLGERFEWDEMIMRSKYPRISELPFDSDRKLMTTHHEMENSESIAFTKGALDVILKRAAFIETKNGISPITADDKRAFEEINFMLSDKGLRVLAFAWRKMKSESLRLEDENQLILLGLVTMMDPPREDSAEAVAACISAGIKPVMITGDHKITASAIARQIGILRNDDKAMDGEAIEKLSDQELREIVPKVAVFARVSPEHKIRIVSAWQELGNVVAMTGDGVNDAPALKKSDIGIAMGITGTEVAKDAASMVLTDDRFATIVKAINNGRSIYGNIKNAIKFLLSGNTAGILAVLYASIAGLAAPFAPVHLLFINLLTDSLPAIAIGVEPAHGHLMNEKPRDISKPILDKKFAIEVLMEGIVIAAVTITAYYIGMSYGGHGAAMTMAFATLSLARLVHGLNCRIDGHITLKTAWSNPYSYLALVAGALMLFSVLLLEPLHKLFEITRLVSTQYIIIVALSIVPLIIVQSAKRILFIKEKYSEK